MSDPETDAGKHSLTPIETESATLFAEAERLNKGKGRVLVAVTVGAAAVIAVLIAVLGNLDNRQAYVDAGQHVATLHETGFEGFWNCVLVNMNQAQIKSADDLEFQLDKRAEHFGHAFAGQLRKCSPSLDSLERDYATLSVPEVLRAPLHELERSSGAMRHALQDLLATLDEHKEQYSSEVAKPLLMKLAESWQQYQRAHTTFTSALREHLN